MPPVRAVIIGLLLGAIPSLFIRSLIRVVGDHPRGFTREVAVVTTKALPAGHVVTMDDITQFSLPESMVTQNIVKPDSASSVVNQKLKFPLAANDPLAWAAFDVVRMPEGGLPPEELVKACDAEMKRRKLADAPDTVAGLRASLTEAR